MSNHDLPESPGPHPLGWVPLAFVVWMVVFGVYGLVERAWLHGASPELLGTLHLLRGTVTSLLLAGLAAWWALRHGGAAARFTSALLAKLHDSNELALQTAAKLSAEKARTEDVLRNVGAAVVVLERDTQVVWANLKACEWFGEDLLGQTCHDRLWNDPEPCSGCSLSQGVCHASERTRKVAGQERVFLVECNPIGGPDGQRLGLIQDITQVKQMQTQVAQAGKLAAIGRLAAGVAHELNNPLAAVASSAEILATHSQRGYPDPAQADADLRHHLARIDKNVFRCKQIIDKLLAFARRPGETYEPVALEPVLEDARDLVAANARAGSVRLSVAGTGGAARPGVPALSLGASNGHAIRQVVVNLLLNAIDATPGDGLVSLEAAPRDGGVELIVRDTGHGMTSDLSSRVFEPFFTTKPVGKGTGLGLYLSRQMVEELHGSIDFESWPGEGTVFRVWLPDNTPLEQKRRLSEGQAAAC